MTRLQDHRRAVLSAWKASLLFMACGCAAPPVEDGVVLTAVTLETVNFKPTVDSGADLALLNGGQRLTLGGKLDGALKVFSQPKGSRVFSSLPAQFGKDFGAFGWETDEEAFGCILLSVRDPETKKTIYSNLVVLAMFSRQNVSEGAVGEAISNYTDAFGKPTSTDEGQAVNYAFWIRDERALMLVSSLDLDGKRSMTVALGDPRVMDELRMSPRKASEDHKAVLMRLKSASAK